MRERNTEQRRKKDIEGKSDRRKGKENIKTDRKKKCEK